MTSIKNSTWQKIATALVAISHRSMNCRGKTRELTTTPRRPKGEVQRGKSGRCAPIVFVILFFLSTVGNLRRQAFFLAGFFLVVRKGDRLPSGLICGRRHVYRGDHSKRVRIKSYFIALFPESFLYPIAVREMH
jgi:hypothetical protein